MRIELAPEASDQIQEQLRRAYPEEGCGVLLGRDRDGVREVERVLGFENMREDSRRTRYLIAPEQFLAADQEARASGLDVVGFFHSHPDHPAVPSAFDLEHAWPFYSYLIASVRNGAVEEVCSWRLAEDRSALEPEVLVLRTRAHALETEKDPNR